MDIRIQEIIANFDFERVRSVMLALDWQWAYARTEDGIPSIGELVLCANSLLEDVIKRPETTCRMGTGGFYAEKEDDLLTLSFQITGWNCDKEGKTY